jgi:hypothetical protein
MEKVPGRTEKTSRTKPCPYPFFPSVESRLGHLLTKRDAGLRFDSHLKEGIGINSNVALQNPTHAQHRD